MGKRTAYKIHYPMVLGKTFLNDLGNWATAGSPTSDAWPVGAIFFTPLPDNPSTLLGFGTWVLLGSGNVTLT
jgi:hypothetical protein